VRLRFPHKRIRDILCYGVETAPVVGMEDWEWRIFFLPIEHMNRSSAIGKTARVRYYRYEKGESD
jgi:hypothetical protein